MDVSRFFFFFSYFNLQSQQNTKTLIFPPKATSLANRTHRVQIGHYLSNDRYRCHIFRPFTNNMLPSLHHHFCQCVYYCCYCCFFARSPLEMGKRIVTCAQPNLACALLLPSKLENNKNITQILPDYNRPFSWPYTCAHMCTKLHANNTNKRRSEQNCLRPVALSEDQRAGNRILRLAFTSIGFL